MPDNYYFINSLTDKTHFLSYIGTTIIICIGNYLGPWIFLTFFLSAFLYTFFYSKRSYLPDLLIPILLSIIFVSITYFFLPEFIGSSTLFFFKIYLSKTILLSFMLISFSLIMCIHCKNISFQFLRIGHRRKRRQHLKFLSDKIKSYWFSLKPPPSHKEKTSPIKLSSRSVKNKDSLGNYTTIISQFKMDETIPYNDEPEEKYFTKIVRSIEDKMQEFHIDGKIVNILKGPVVDTYELELGQGIKVAKIKGITEDLSLALSGTPLRIIHQMKGKTTMGIEIPRTPRQSIALGEILKSKEYRNNTCKLPLAIGKDTFGKISIIDLSKMPHMLIAGSTGTGKSVFINTILMSLLVKCSPEKLKLILIDPKQLELALYEKIPHLAIPVVTDPKKSLQALMWVQEEMERRYTILKSFSVRSIEGHNLKLQHASAEDLRKIKPYFTDEKYDLPYIGVIVDEFADLILSRYGKDIENSVCRLAAKARAAGIHLIVATQRPSVDVITGLIKSNFSTRISFRVISSIDSRTILNATGAEKLLDCGDLLYKNGVETCRIHSSYVDENQIERFIRVLSSFSVNFNSSATKFMGSNDLPSQFTKTREEDDELYKIALTVLYSQKTISTSMLQRKLHIGYNRAADIIQQLESDGVIGPAISGKPRKILKSSEKFSLDP